MGERIGPSGNAEAGILTWEVKMGKDKKSRPWHELLGLWDRVMRHEENVRDVFGPHVGDRYERPDGRMVVVLGAITEGDVVEQTIEVALEKPAEFVTLKFALEDPNERK